MSENGSNFDSGIFPMTDASSSADENCVDKKISTPVKIRTNFLGNISNFFSSAFSNSGSTKNLSESSKTNIDVDADVVVSNGRCPQKISDSPKSCSGKSPVDPKFSESFFVQVKNVSQIEKDNLSIKFGSPWENVGEDFGEKKLKLSTTNFFCDSVLGERSGFFFDFLGRFSSLWSLSFFNQVSSDLVSVLKYF